MEPVYFTDPGEWHEWLAENHNKEKEIVLLFYKVGAKKPTLTYAQALDAALAFGWIDGVRKGVNAESYTIRYTPRKKSSTWSQVNIKRVEEMKKDGLLHPAGLKAYEGRDLKKEKLYSFEQDVVKMDEEFEKLFRENANAWAFFSAQSPSYRRVATWYIISPKREETRLRRLEIIIQKSAEGLRLDSIDSKARKNRGNPS